MTEKDEIGAVSPQRNWTILMAAANPRRCGPWRRLLAPLLPQATFVTAGGADAAEDLADREAPRSAILSTGICCGGLDPAQLAERLRKRNPDLHIAWILDRDAEGATWLAHARDHDFDLFTQPLRGLEVAGRCLRASAGTAPARGGNARIADLARLRGERLFESDERYRFLVNTCSDGVMLIRVERDGPAHRIAEVNNQLCQWLGYPREEFLALEAKDIFEPSRMSHVEARMASLGIYRHIFFDSVLLARDGQQLAAGITARLFNFAQKPHVILLVHPPEIVGIPTRGNAAHRPPVRQTGQIIYEYTPGEQRMRVSGATRPITGYSKAQIESAQGRDLLHFVHEDDRRIVLAEMNATLENLGAYERRYRIRHAAGETRYVEDTGIVLPGDSHCPARILGSVRDITQQVLAELAAQRAEQTLHHSKRLESLGVLAGGIAHDFNNILAAIIGLTDMSIQALEGVDPEVLADLREALGAAHRAKDLVKQILAFSRQSGEDHEPLYLHAVVREVLSLLRASLPPSIRIIDAVDPESGMVLANATQMHQVIMNYCTNGVQAMSEKGGELAVRLENFEVSRRFAATNPKLRPGPYLKLTVSDRGHGMAPGVVRRVFDPFYTTKGPGEGAGMGLAMVYGIVADHGGAVSVESVLGQGTEFSTYLPRVESVVQGETRRGSAARRGSERILVVDDEQLVRRFCERALGQLGYAVRTEGSPLVALELLKADPEAFDIVLTDNQMPEMTGLALARRIQKLRPRLPVLLFTGFSHQIDAEEARKAGIREIVSKPVVVSQLADTLRQVLAHGTHEADAEKNGKGDSVA